MWVRKRIEITLAELWSGFLRCLCAGDRAALQSQIIEAWKDDDALVCLSVRSGFDLLLASSGWAPGSEIILSGLTIPDMPRIVRENGLVPVAVDVELETVAPSASEIEARITPRTKAIVVAHLFGGLCDVGALVDLARRYNLLLIEDCAQAYVGTEYQGDRRADVSMFSFGPIKTNTSLGGGVLWVRRQELLERMRSAQSHWPVQSRLTFARRLLKYSFVRLLSTRLICGFIYRSLKLFGKNHDALATRMARGFAGPRFFERIRQQPSAPLLYLLRRKLRSFDSRMIVRRQKLGNLLSDHCVAGLRFLGGQMQRPTYWVMPILVEEPQRLVECLWDAGFDASRNCSLVSLVGGGIDKTSNDHPTATAAFILDNMVIVPFDARMPRLEILRMAQVINQFEPRSPEPPAHPVIHVGDCRAESGSDDFASPALVIESN